MATVVFTGEPGTVRHGTKLLSPGDVVECTDHDADQLIKLGNFEIERSSKSKKKKAEKEPELLALPGPKEE